MPEKEVCELLMKVPRAKWRERGTRYYELKASLGIYCIFEGHTSPVLVFKAINNLSLEWRGPNVGRLFGYLITGNLLEIDKAARLAAQEFIEDK